MVIMLARDREEFSQHGSWIGNEAGYTAQLFQLNKYKSPTTKTLARRPIVRKAKWLKFLFQPSVGLLPDHTHVADDPASLYSTHSDGALLLLTAILPHFCIPTIPVV
jgi:hypothetical protein